MENYEGFKSSGLWRCDMEDRYGNFVSIPGPFHSVSEMKRANADAGFHYFDRDTMRFFESKVESPPIAGRLLITSEKGPHGPRMFSVVGVADDGGTERMSEFQEFSSKEEARDWISEQLRRDK